MAIEDAQSQASVHQVFGGIVALANRTRWFVDAAEVPRGVAAHLQSQHPQEFSPSMDMALLTQHVSLQLNVHWTQGGNNKVVGRTMAENNLEKKAHGNGYYGYTNAVAADQGRVSCDSQARLVAELRQLRVRKRDGYLLMPDWFYDLMTDVVAGTGGRIKRRGEGYGAPESEEKNVQDWSFLHTLSGLRRKFTHDQTTWARLLEAASTWKLPQKKAYVNGQLHQMYRECALSWPGPATQILGFEILPVEGGFQHSPPSPDWGHYPDAPRSSRSASNKVFVWRAAAPVSPMPPPLARAPSPGSHKKTPPVPPNYVRRAHDAESTVVTLQAKISHLQRELQKATPKKRASHSSSTPSPFAQHVKNTEMSDEEKLHKLDMLAKELKAETRRAVTLKSRVDELLAIVQKLEAQCDANTSMASFRSMAAAHSHGDFLSSLAADYVAAKIGWGDFRTQLVQHLQQNCDSRRNSYSLEYKKHWAVVRDCYSVDEALKQLALILPGVVPDPDSTLRRYQNDNDDGEKGTEGIRVDGIRNYAERIATLLASSDNMDDRPAASDIGATSATAAGDDFPAMLVL